MRKRKDDIEEIREKVEKYEEQLNITISHSDDIERIIKDGLELNKILDGNEEDDIY